MSSPASVSCIVIACCVLHNVAIRNGLELDVPEPAQAPQQPDDALGDDDDLRYGVRPHLRGIRAREEIVQAFFARH